MNIYETSVFISAFRIISAKNKLVAVHSFEFTKDSYQDFFAQ